MRVTAHDSNSYYAGRETILVAEALARCNSPDAPDCSLIRTKRKQIITLLRERATSRDEELAVGGIEGLGECGTKKGTAFLKELSGKIAHEQTRGDQAADARHSKLMLISNAIGEIEAR